MYYTFVYPRANHINEEQPIQTVSEVRDRPGCLQILIIRCKKEKQNESNCMSEICLNATFWRPEADSKFTRLLCVCTAVYAWFEPDSSEHGASQNF